MFENNYFLTYDDGYFCCVNTPNPVPVYGQGGTGCQGAQIGIGGIVEQTQLIANGNTITVTEGQNQLQYGMQIALSSVITHTPTPLQNPLTCGILLFSNFTYGARKVRLVESLTFNPKPFATADVLFLRDTAGKNTSSQANDSNSNKKFITILNLVTLFLAFISLF